MKFFYVLLPLIAFVFISGCHHGTKPSDTAQHSHPELLVDLNKAMATLDMAEFAKRH